MSLTVFNISKYRERTPVFGYSMSKEEVAEQVKYQGVTILESEDLEAGGMFGNAVYGAVTFDKRPGIARDFKIGNAIVEVSSSKNIVKTALVNTTNHARGTVKEYISRGDDVVTISGVLVSPKGSAKRPYNLINELASIVDLGAEFTVQNELLYRLGIVAVVIEKIDWLPFQYINTQPFRLSCISDTDDTYKINEKYIPDA